MTCLSSGYAFTIKIVCEAKGLTNEASVCRVHVSGLVKFSAECGQVVKGYNFHPLEHELSMLLCLVETFAFGCD